MPFFRAPLQVDRHPELTKMACRDSSPDKLKQMEANFIPFGAGKRVCLGQHMSWLEIYKIVPQLLRAYSFSFTNPEKDWEVRNNM